MAEYTASEAAKLLGIDVSRVKQLCRAGRLGHKRGHYWIVRDDQIEAYRRAGPGKPGPKPK